MQALERAVLEGNRRALARLITLVENEDAEGRAALNVLFPYSGKAHLVGVTGASGAGKSTLVNSLVQEVIARNPEKKVAVIAVDPTSPFTGGAVLGDRIRMRAIAEAPQVFIRSMASRGALGGLAQATQGVALVLDAAGFDLILIETVGAGQAEVEIASLAHSVLVVEAPGLGDDIQAAKAGILEIADILVLNKADRAGVEATEMALHAMLSLGYAMAEEDEKKWVPPILKTVATEGEGCVRLAGMLQEHASYLKESGGWEQRDEKRMQHLVQALFERQRSRDWQQVLEKAGTRELLRQVTRRELSPYRAIERL
jgi:LAO/AO transport system kinase